MTPSPTLYMVMLGGQHPGARVELHDIVFTAVDDQLERKYAQLKSLWFGDKKQVHIDGWMRLSGCGEHRIVLTPTPIQQEEKLYFFNLGGYCADVFGEDHRYGVVVAKDAQRAKWAAKRQASGLWQLPHKDNLIEVDQCMLVDKVGDWHVSLVKEPHQGIYFENCYIPL